MEWSWKLNEEYEKTKRIKRVVNEDFTVQQKEEITNYVLNDVFNENKHLDTINMGKLSFKKDNLREKNNEKLFSRGHIIQRKVNPFMIDNDYKTDLDVQNKFLIPKDSNDEKGLNK